jgi:hypothetical protein
MRRISFNLEPTGGTLALKAEECVCLASIPVTWQAAREFARMVLHANSRAPLWLEGKSRAYLHNAWA